MIAVADYGASNTRSVLRALRAAGAAAELTTDPAVVRGADRVVLPGVGNFAPAARRLAETGLGEAISDAARAGRPVLGICLGLQLFFAESEEAPGVPGLGLLPGVATRFVVDLPIPHVGWARVEPTVAGRSHPVLRQVLQAPDFFYHVHSYHPAGLAGDDVLATGTYDAVFPTIVGHDNVLGAQFHPEKSQRAGIELLDAFARWRP